jgi:hypothetical protein
VRTVDRNLPLLQFDAPLKLRVPINIFLHVSPLGQRNHIGASSIEFHLPRARQYQMLVLIHSHTFPCISISGAL